MPLAIHQHFLAINDVDTLRGRHYMLAIEVVELVGAWGSSCLYALDAVDYLLGDNLHAVYLQSTLQRSMTLGLGTSCSRLHGAINVQSLPFFYPKVMVVTSTGSWRNS